MEGRENGRVFFYLATFRKTCSEGGDCEAGSEPSRFYLQEATRLYLVLMTTTQPVDVSELENYKRLSTRDPESDLERLHLLWLINSFARYLCFIEKDYVESQKLTESLMVPSTRLLAGSFLKFDTEAKCFQIFPALNTARLSAYRGNGAASQRQFAELTEFIRKPQAGIMLSFPTIIRETLETNAEALRSVLSDNIKPYFLAKIKKGTSRLDA